LSNRGKLLAAFGDPAPAMASAIGIALAKSGTAPCEPHRGHQQNHRAGWPSLFRLWESIGGHYLPALRHHCGEAPHKADIRRMNAIIVIPARMASTRLPGKPLADIAGEAMIVRVWRQAVKAGIGPVLVAAADEVIVAAVERAGGRAVLTDPDLASGSDRVHQALERDDPERRFDAVINLQGDLPALDPAVVTTVAALLRESGADIATLAAPILDPADCDNPHVVKPIVA
jgi:CTP:molybdopterin cytidylyltransferase MocA